MWRGGGKDDKTRRRTGNDYVNSNDPALEAAVALSESELEITFRFGGKEAAAISDGYTDLVICHIRPGLSHPSEAKRVRLQAR